MNPHNRKHASTRQRCKLGIKGSRRSGDANQGVAGGSREEEAQGRKRKKWRDSAGVCT